MAERTPSKQLTKADVESLLAATAANVSRKFYADDAAAHLTQFVRILQNTPVQQQLNCCQSTAIAYALSALGFPTSVDDIFWMVQVPVENAVGAGMTLAETFDLATRYIHHAKLPVFVDCHHFDAFAEPTPEDLWAACLADTVAGPEEALAFNFHSGIAHGWAEGGGGHFSVLLGTAGSTEPGEPGDVVMADVHPIKYGAYWSSPLRQMFAAVMEKDSCGRARGILRFGLAKKALPRPTASMRKAPALVDWTSPPTGHDEFLLRRFIPRQWGAALGVANMSGMSALALAANAVHGFRHEFADMDACMRTLRCSYVEHLHEYQSSENIFEIAQRLASSGIVDDHQELKVLRVELGNSGAELRQALIDAGVVEADVAVILPVDINVAKGGPYVALDDVDAGKLSHGPKTWTAVASIDSNASLTDPCGIVLCSANQVLRDGRLWATSFERLAAATRQGAVKDGFAVVIQLALQSNQARLDSLYRRIIKTGEGEIDAKELHEAMTAMGVPLGEGEAAKLIGEFDRHGGAASLSRDELFEMLNTWVGYHGGHEEGSARHMIVARFMEKNGCVRNELGFATCHLAVETSDIVRNVAFYNNTLGWPLYKTVDHARAGPGEGANGSSWASYGPFASFVVFHAAPVPVGALGHGPWSSAHDCPEPLWKDGAGGCAGSIAFKDVPAGFFGCILEPAFYDKQMARIAAKDASVRWLEVTDVQERFGGDEIDRAICFKDPDGYPLIFFVSTRKGGAFTERFPAAPFVYSAAFRVSPDTRADMALIRGRITKDMLAQLTSDQLEATKTYYQDILGCKLLFEGEWDGRQRLEFEWEGHFVCLKSDPENVPPSLRANKLDTSMHNMGGNKGLVPVPHFGPNTNYANFAAIRKKVDDAMANHHVPAEDVWSLTLTGRAPPFNYIDSHNMLFPKDPDSCLSMFLTDPSGNTFEVKWYLDFGEMFHHRGEVGVAGLTIDNSMIPDHFPPAVIDLMEERALKGDADARTAMDLVD